MGRTTSVVIDARFKGPPSSGNGGYVAGLLGKTFAGSAAAILKAPIPLATPLRLTVEDHAATLSTADDQLIARAEAAADADLPRAPPAPSLEAAREAGGRYVGLQQPFHPICFTCGPTLAPGDGLRVFVGQLADAPAGHVAGVWTPDPAFADRDGLAATEIVWAAMDCPGFYAWVGVLGRHGALLGSMQAEVIERPRAGAETIVLAWPIEQAGRKEIAGVALYALDGRLLARARQIWISMNRPPTPAGAAMARNATTP